MKFYRLIFSLTLPFLFTAMSCNKETEYDEIPYILDPSYVLFKDIQGRDTAIMLKFTFTDGDGNVGLTQADTLPTRDKNVWVDYFEKQNGTFTKIIVPGTTDTLNFNSRINKFSDKNPTKANVELMIDISLVLADTIKLDYYIKDRDLNRSNKVTTGPIILQH